LPTPGRARLRRAERLVTPASGFWLSGFEIHPSDFLSMLIRG
jgi:hypothetical protein